MFLRVSWYRWRATLRHQRGGFLYLALLVALLGGIAMGSLSIARTTQSSYPTFLASTNPSDLTMAVYQSVANGGPGQSLSERIAHLRGVRTVATLESPTIVPLAANGAPRLGSLSSILVVGSIRGLLVTQDRLAVVQGVPANPNVTDQVEMTASAAQLLGVHVGEIVPLGLYSRTQRGLPGFGTPGVPPRRTFRARLTGIAVQNTGIVEDDVDRHYGFIFVTPATVREANAVSPSANVLYGLRLDPHGPSGAVVERELASIVPRGLTYEFHVAARVTANVELAIKPESVALGAFGAIAALACLVLAAQAIARQLRAGDEDRRGLRALGARPSEVVADGVVGTVGAVLVGTVLATGIAVALSPLGPLGPVRPVYPDHGVSFDWTVLGIGATILAVALCGFTLVQAILLAPHRVDRRRVRRSRRSAIASGAQASGLPLPGVVGVHFAFEPGSGRTSVPVRSVLIGAVFAVMLVVATLTFASGLSTLVSQPRLYGWNWNYALNPTNDVPPGALAALARDPNVAAWSGYDYTDVSINDQTVPILIQTPRAAVAPPILSGHGVDATNQIVLGAATMAQLHTHIGATVKISYGSPANYPIYIKPTPLVVVGTATLPAVGYASFVAEHTAMGDGAVAATGVQPPAFLRATHNPDPNLNGPNLVFVRLRPGVSSLAGRASLQRIAVLANAVFARDPRAQGNSVGVLGVQRPAQIVNYRTIGSTPVLLAVALAIGAIVALGVTLAASVRRRRRDLALLKTLGFSRRQLTSTISWQASVDAIVGIVAGIPLGIALGRELWTIFARDINAVPDPTVPLGSVILVGLGALLFANLAAAIPANLAARTPVSHALRAE
jgi:hypothetical protein